MPKNDKSKMFLKILEYLKKGKSEAQDKVEESIPESKDNRRRREEGLPLKDDSFSIPIFTKKF